MSDEQRSRTALLAVLLFTLLAWTVVYLAVRPLWN